MIGMADTHSNNMDGVMSMGIMNALRTGNPQIDMILALLLPFALNFLITSFKKLYEWIHQKGLFFGYYKAHPKYESRVITHTVVRDEYGDVINVDSEFDTHNSALIKAVRLYLYNVKKLRLKDADIDLMKNEDKSSSSDGHEEKYDEYGNLSRGNTLADHMSQYDVVPSVPKDKYISIGQYGTSMTTIELMIGQNQEEDNGNEDDDNDERSHRRRNRTKETMVKYQFRAKNGSAIDDFLAKAFEYYLGVLRAQEDHSRYLFELKVSNDENSTNHTFKRYRLSEEKTFASLFFSEKDSLLTLIDNFRNRSGRYSIAGYPHKLGLLLHGPPGTGKFHYLVLILTVNVHMLSNHILCIEINFYRQNFPHQVNCPVYWSFNHKRALVTHIHQHRADVPFLLLSEKGRRAIRTYPTRFSGCNLCHGRR